MYLSFSTRGFLAILANVFLLRIVVSYVTLTHYLDIHFLNRIDLQKLCVVQKNYRVLNKLHSLKKKKKSSDLSSAPRN